MADKLHTQSSNLVSFVAGERPSADKFNAVNKYFSRNFEQIGKALGDLYDRGFPHLNTTDTYLTYKWNVAQAGNTEGRPLDILNLARIIGPASNLNARMLAGSNQITETIPTGVSEYNTQYKIIGGLAETIDGLILSTSNSLTNPNSYYVDTDRSTIYFGQDTTQQYTVVYNTDPSEYYGGVNYNYSSFNVIPDPNSTAELTITESFGDYIVVLPTINAQQSGLNNLSDVSVITPDEPNQGLQLKLPAWMSQDGVFTDTENIIPSNSIYLKNRTTGEVYTEATYYYMSEIQIKISGVELCLDEDHSFCLICVGTDITTSIDDLRVKWFKHTHDGSFGESRISIYDLKDIFKYAPRTGLYKPSEDAWNYAPQYLHRDGWSATSTDTTNGKNAMRGPLMMGLESFDPLSSTDISNDEAGSSQPIYFGGTESYIKRIDDILEIVNKKITSRATENNTVLGTDVYVSALEDNIVDGANVYANALEAVTINSDTLIAAVNDLNNQITALQRYLWDNQSESILSSTIDLDSTTGKDLLSRDVKASRLKIAVNKIEFQVDPGVEFEFPDDDRYVNGDMYYIDGIAVCEGLRTSDPALAVLGINYLSIEGQKHLLDVFFDTSNSTDTTLTNVLLAENHYKLFVVSKETNTSYYFKLWKYNGVDRIYSPTYRIVNEGRGYRPFGLFIDRGTTLYLNYKDSQSQEAFDADYIYEHEYIIDIDQKMLGAKMSGSPYEGSLWSGDLEINSVRTSDAAYVILDYDTRLNDEIGIINISEYKSFYPTSISHDSDPTLISNLGINKLFATTYPIERNCVHAVSGDSLEGYILGADILTSNSNQDIIKIHGNKVFIKIAHNIYVHDNRGEGHSVINGAMIFDKLIIKETIHNGAINVEVKPFRSDWGLSETIYDSDDTFERFHSIDFNEPS